MKRTQLLQETRKMHFEEVLNIWTGILVLLDGMAPFSWAGIAGMLQRFSYNQAASSRDDS